MLDEYRPMSLLMALWPTQEFEFPDDVTALGDRLCEKFAVFTERRMLQLPPETGVNGAPPAIPAEMPRLVLLDQAQRWVLELGPAKISLRHATGQPASLGESLDVIEGMLNPLHAWLAENYNFRVYRHGLVAQFFCPTRSSANEKIAQYFLQTRALQGTAPHEIQLSIHARLMLDERTMVNRWLRVHPLRSVDPRHVDFAAQIEVDINTLPENTGVKTGRDLAQFLAAIRRHLEHEIPLLSDPDFLA